MVRKISSTSDLWLDNESDGGVSCLVAKVGDTVLVEAGVVVLDPGSVKLLKCFPITCVASPTSNLYISRVSITIEYEFFFFCFGGGAMESNDIVSECHISIEIVRCCICVLEEEELYVQWREVSGYIYTCMSRHIRVLDDDIMT